jgi:hypothetical protein
MKERDEALIAELRQYAENYWQHYKEAGIEWVEWTICDDQDCCPYCRAMAGKVMRLVDLPFVQHPDCENEIEGCRCIVIAIMGPEITVSPDAENYHEIMEAYSQVIQAARDRYEATKDHDELQKMWNLTLDDVLRQAAELHESRHESRA